MIELKYFKREEFACKCGCGAGEFEMDPEFLIRLDHARTLAGTPFVVNSGYRCEKHNRAVGGAKKSPHMDGIATDIRCVDNTARHAILEGLFRAGFVRIGIYPRFIHTDNRPTPVPVVWLG